jgi:hypothetical protein
MLPGEPTLPETIVAPDGQTVNRLFAWLCSQADHRLGKELYESLRALQVHWFAHQRNQLPCPTCGAMHLIRKGWRSRRIATSRGRLNLVVLQAHCTACGRTFRPLNQALGLPSSRRILDELVEKATSLGTQVSFARAKKMLAQILGPSLSAESIRRKLSQQAMALNLPQPEAGETVLVDATQVKAGSKPRGESVYLAMTARPGVRKGARSTCCKKLIHLHVGNSNPLKQKLKTLSVTHLVHDGGDDVGQCAPHVQRCRWHMSHQLKHYLWQDGVPHAQRAIFQKTLRGIIKDREHGPERYPRWIKSLASLRLETTVEHLRNAATEIFSYVKEPGFAYIDTSPLEREMRELNRRADIGARWSPKGLENVLKVLFHQRLNESPKHPR